MYISKKPYSSPRDQIHVYQYKNLLKPARPDTCISVKNLTQAVSTCLSVKNLTQARETRYMYICKKPYSSAGDHIHVYK